MKQIEILNQSRPLVKNLTAGSCTTIMCRFRGMMFRGKFPDTWGLLFDEKRDSVVNTTIHMFFVFIDLGVIWINEAGEVVDLCVAKKWVTIKAPKKPARYFLEISPDRLNEFQIGDQIRFVEK
jgi:uncharacterized membrane protein (UPF0127 family)